MFDLASVRADLPAVRRAAYLNTGTFGPLAEATRQAVVDYVDRATEQGRTGATVFESWMALIGDARTALAGAVGAAPDDIALTHSTSDGINAVLGGLEWQPGDVVVTTGSEHPGLTEPLVTLTRRRGVVVREVVVEGVDDPTAAVIAAMDERTRLVAVSHVLWTEGTVLDARALADAARAAGVPLLVDGAQGAGLHPARPAVAGLRLLHDLRPEVAAGPVGDGRALRPPRGRRGPGARPGRPTSPATTVPRAGRRCGRAPAASTSARSRWLRWRDSWPR